MVSASQYGTPHLLPFSLSFLCPLINLPELTDMDWKDCLREPVLWLQEYQEPDFLGPCELANRLDRCDMKSRADDLVNTLVLLHRLALIGQDFLPGSPIQAISSS